MNTVADGRLRLHGYPVSNYFNIARAALLEKQANFEVVSLRASRDEQFLQLSPMGKIPMLETPHGWLAETVAILEYLEDTIESPALYPQDAFQRARARQVINIVQMYVEVPARSLFPGVFSNGTNSVSAINTAREMLDRSTAALNRIVQPAPFLFGATLSHADLFAYYCLDIAERVTQFVYDRSILGELPTWAGWPERIASRDSTRTVLGDFDPAFAAYLVDHQAAYSVDRAPLGQPASQRVELNS